MFKTKMLPLLVTLVSLSTISACEYYPKNPTGKAEVSEKTGKKEIEKPQTLLAISGKTMGTTYSVKWFTESPEKEHDKETAYIKKSVAIRLAELNKSMSTYDRNSEISELNRSGKGVYEISKHFYNTLVIANAVASHTNGAFDATVSPLVDLWGFGKNNNKEIPSNNDITNALKKTGYQKLSLIPQENQVEKLEDVTINLSAVAKGYAVDVLAETLEAADVKNFFIEVGGEALARGNKPQNESWKVGVEKPVANERSLQHVVEISGKAIATSGDYRNYFEEDGKRYSHTIDPFTGRPIVHRLASVSVLKDTCAEADAYATALMVMGDEKGIQFAKENNIPALFLIKSEDGFIEKATGGFTKHILDLKEGDLSDTVLDDKVIEKAKPRIKVVEKAKPEAGNSKNPSNADIK